MRAQAGMEAGATRKGYNARGLAPAEPATDKVRTWGLGDRSGRSPAEPVRGGLGLNSSTLKSYSHGVRLVIFERLSTGRRGIPEGKAL